ncbi:hypothetical protein CBOM_08078 [Ceraceosorus bombacis]|uniref:Uncharacterized protein n=1 Tax=Ceraceosorus bombacis TaxID=401625 RepID=A0A0P1BTT9_9BASI|nr:hypothetical protein CBOM_08078 [Ceraceosorus bombacis]
MSIDCHTVNLKQAERDTHGRRRDNSCEKERRRWHIAELEANSEWLADSLSQFRQNKKGEL